MKQRLIAREEIITIDIAQPGTPELLSILKKYDSSSIKQVNGNRSHFSITPKKQYKKSEKALSKGLKGFKLGSKMNGSMNSSSRQSCAVTAK